jgi:hypothetical protein
LWALPALAFFCAGQFRWGLVFAGCAAAGVILGSALTGHPLDYPVQAVRLAGLCVGAHAMQHSLASELQPTSGDTNALFILGGLLLLRRLAGLKAAPFLRDPVFWLVCLSWTASLQVARFWNDWGWPALMVMVAWDLQLLLDSRAMEYALRRLAVAGGLAAITFLAITSDINGHWTYNLATRYLSESDDPGVKGWLPEKGGIFYSADMTLFYGTFFKNPAGDWRYMPGFEPAWMPAEDFEVYQRVLWNSGAAKAYEPWVKKMRPQDRLVLQGDPGGPPAIPKLEWRYGASGVWLGRLPGHHPDSTPVMIQASERNESTNNAAPAAGPATPVPKPDGHAH